MTLIAFLNAAFARSQAITKERALYRKLSRLQPHLLDDIGVSLEDGKVIFLREEAQQDALDAPAASVASGKTIAEKSITLPLPERSLSSEESAG